MRRFAISFLLPLLMLLTQHGAAVHEIGHLSPSQSQHRTPTSRDEPLANDALCLSCLAYASIGSAAAPEVFQALLLSFGQPTTPPVAVAVLAAEALAPRSRGPPPTL
jgi:hypothetical protein